MSSGQMKIRRLSKQDLPCINDIERLGYSHPWAEGVFADCFRAGYRLFGAEQGVQLQGYGVLAFMYDEAHLLNLCVRPSCRGRGLARELLRHMIAEAAAGAMARMVLEVRVGNRVARQLYSSEGFEVVGNRPGYYPDGQGREDAVVMALGLAGPADPVE